MSEWRVLADSLGGGLRAALVSGRHLVAIEIDPPGREMLEGRVAPARIVRMATGLGAILRFEDGSEALLDGAATGSAGDRLTVQYLRGPRGDKLALVSRRIALSGPTLVHLPLESSIQVSRRFGDDGARLAQAKAALDGLPGGWILRRSAVSVTQEALAAEAAVLAEEGRAALGGAVLPGSDAVRRLMTDAALPPPQAIEVSGMPARAATQRWCTAFAPALASVIRANVGSVFEAADLDAAIAALRSARVTLPEGGSLVIEPTEALTAIDVNAGAARNVLAADLAAADEVARQLRLRHIGGLVVVDFVSLPRPADRARVVARLKRALADDPARTHVLAMSELGLVELARENRGPGLEIGNG